VGSFGTGVINPAERLLKIFLAGEGLNWEPRPVQIILLPQIVSSILAIKNFLNFLFAQCSRLQMICLRRGGLLSSSRDFARSRDRRRTLAQISRITTSHITSAG
jgi:hypothetical protein